MYRYRRAPINFTRLVLIATVILALVLAGIVFSLPKVTGTSPRGANLSARSPITITFSAGMNPASVESRIRIEPAITGAFAWSGNTLSFVPAAEWPVGVVRVSLEAGATSASRLPVLFGAQWQFSVGAPSIAFLMKTGDAADIWVIPITGGEPTRITDERFGVDGFAIAPDGTQFVYAALRADGGADLKRVYRDGSGVAVLIDCAGDRCTAPAFSGDGRRIAFERHPVDRLEYSTVEALDLADNSHITLEDDPSHMASFPRFAPDGRLAYLDLLEQAIFIHDFVGGDSKRIPDTAGEMGDWSPDGQYVVF